MKELILFKGLDQKELEIALQQLQKHQKKYQKGQMIYQAGNTTDTMGVVLSGSVTIESNDLWGNRTVLSHIGVNDFFAETYALLQNEPMLVDVIANEDCEILHLNLKVLRDNEYPSWKMKVISNLLTISTRKSLHLSSRSFHTSPKSIRSRVLSYLNSISIQQNTNDFYIPFDRQQLADYLNVERTALSKELKKMKEDGYIKYKKNHFLLINTH